ncbi:hypothetical protein ACN24K_28105 [Streptomyces microflavus]
MLVAHGCPADAPPALIRSSHLAAGYAAGVAQAHATALGLRSRPIGSWQQADLGAALGDAPDTTGSSTAWPSPEPRGGQPTRPHPSSPVHTTGSTGPSAPTTPSGKEEHP